jgi:predicted transcriptional regulator YdeE
MQKNPATALIDKLGDEIYAVYTDYESHHTGDYTFVLGFKVSSIQNLPAGLRGVEIPGGEYAVITSDPGPVMQVVPAIWEKIWSLPHLEHRRSYQADFELYGQRAMHPDHAEVDIYLGLR